MRTSLLTLTLAGALMAASIGCSKSHPGSAGLTNRIDFTTPDVVKKSGAVGVYDDSWASTDMEIVLGNRTHEPVFQLEGMNVQTQPGDEQLPLLFLIGSDTIQVSRILSLGEFREPVVLPRKFRSLDTLGIRIVASKKFVPARLGTSNDERTLAFRIHSVALVPLDSTGGAVRSGFTFPSDEENNPSLQGLHRDGWMGDSARIVLYNTDESTTLVVRGYCPPDIYVKVPTLEIYLDGALQEKRQLTTQGGGINIDLRLDDAEAGNCKHIIVLKANAAFVPAERNINSDRRRISYQIKKIGLE